MKPHINLVTKSKLAAYLLLVLGQSLPLSAVAGDDVSVSVNGRTYVCGEGTASKFMGCECRDSGSNSQVLLYMEYDRSTGTHRTVKNLASYRSASECKAALREAPICQSRR